MSQVKLPKAFDLIGRAALFTVGAELLGMQHSKALTEVGAGVAVADISPVAAKRDAAKIKAVFGGESALALILDVDSPESVANDLEFVLACVH